MYGLDCAMWTPRNRTCAAFVRQPLTPSFRVELVDLRVDLSNPGAQAQATGHEDRVRQVTANTGWLTSGFTAAAATAGH